MQKRFIKDYRITKNKKRVLINYGSLAVLLSIRFILSSSRRFAVSHESTSNLVRPLDIPNKRDSTNNECKCSTLKLLELSRILSKSDSIILISSSLMSNDCKRHLVKYRLYAFNLGLI